MESFCQVGGTGNHSLPQRRPPLFNKENSLSSPLFRCFRGKKRSAGEGSSQASKRLATASSNDNQIDLDSLGPIDVKVGK